MKKLTRGSDWIKCDLHIHTPASFSHGYGDRNQPATWEKFIKELEELPADFKIIGINGYLTIDGYKRIQEEKAKGRLFSPINLWIGLMLNRWGFWSNS